MQPVRKPYWLNPQNTNRICHLSPFRRPLAPVLAITLYPCSNLLPGVSTPAFVPHPHKPLRNPVNLSQVNSLECSKLSCGFNLIQSNSQDPPHCPRGPASSAPVPSLSSSCSSTSPSLTLLQPNWTFFLLLQQTNLISTSGPLHMLFPLSKVAFPLFSALGGQGTGLYSLPIFSTHKSKTTQIQINLLNVILSLFICLFHLCPSVSIFLYFSVSISLCLCLSMSLSVFLSLMHIHEQISLFLFSCLSQSVSLSACVFLSVLSSDF